MMNVEEEMMNIRKEQKKNKQRSTVPLLVYSMAALLCWSPLICDAIQYSSYKWLPDTWKCSNPRCGYENYVGINHCALCGTARK